MSETITKRLYIGGLSNSVTEDEISERFSRFGKVSDLSLKSRHDDEGTCVKVFAHLNIEGNEENIKKCFSTYQNTKWKGSVLKLQYAKESFLTRLEKERESEVDTMKEDLPGEAKTSEGEWKPPPFTKLNGPAVPGTPIPGKKDWVVGKYGRVLPILNVKKSYKLKAIKHDPSKFCHAARIFKDENTDNASTSATCDNLTWEITKPDSEMTKKRKGECPPSSPSKKSKKSPVVKPKDYFTSDVYKSISQGNDSAFDDFEVVKIGQKKNSVESASVPSRFDSDYDDDDMDDGKINMSVNNVSSSKSPIKSQLISNNKIQSPQAKSELLANTKLNELSEKDKKHNSLKAKGDISKDKKLTKASANQKTVATPKSESPCNERRKVPEFAGLAMLTRTTLNRTSQSPENKTDVDVTLSDKMMEKKQEPQALGEKGKSETKSTTKRKESEMNDGILPSKRSTSIKGPLSPQSPLLKKVKGPFTQASVNEHGKEINQDLSTPKSKKIIKKTEIEAKLPPSAKIKSDPKTLTATSKKSVLREEDGNDSTSSADTDEIIARCKIKQKTDSSTSKRKDIPVSKVSVLNESMGLSEFSASAPEVLSNSFGNSSRAFSSIASDSYDSDLDSNDFVLVAKKLALKASSSQSVQKNSFKESTAVPETVTEPVKKAAPEVKKSHLISATKKPTDVRVRDSLPPEKSLQSKLLEIANSRHKPSQKRTSSEKSSKESKNKHIADNEKRLQALDEQKKIKEQQKQIVKAALENVDSACTKRIVFSSSDEEDSAGEHKQSMKPSQEVSVKGTKSKDDSKNSSAKLTLLDSSSSGESDYEEMFKSKPQFEGKKGEMLMEMQRKIGDSRFQMDEKFMDSSDSDEEKEKAEKDTEEQNSLKDEKKMNLEVLENVVGKSKMDHFTAKMKKKTKHIIDMNAVRFDPTKIKPQNPELKQKDEMSEAEKEEEMEAEPSSPQPVAKSIKSEEKTKDEKKKKKVKEQSKSNVTMSSSLVNMLKSQAKENDAEAADDTSFSLLRQFDEDNENEESSDEDDDDKGDKAITPLGNLLSPKEMENSMKAHEDENENSSDEDSDEEDNTRSSDEDSDEEDNTQSSDEEDSTQSSDEEDSTQSSDEDPDEEDNTQTSGEDSDEEDNAQSTDEENFKQSSDEDFDKEDDTDKSEADTETNSNRGVSGEEVTSQPNKATHFNMHDFNKQEEEDDDDVDEKDELKSITTQYNPLEEKERALISAGRTDIRFTKKDWLERWDEIRTDLMKLCRRKHKDAGKRKRVLNEKKRKKDILKNVKRKPWLKK